MDHLCDDPRVHVVLLPRNHKQAEQIRETNPEWFEHGRVTIPARAMDGLNLLWHSDLVISGGGTIYSLRNNLTP